MRKSNKGFTLVEMLLTLAILSVVMVGVISIMRSSSSFYKTGVKEVDLQEEAQVATAQIENMLIDATSNVTYSGGTYNLVLSDGQSVSLKRDATKKQLMYKVGTANFQPMADYVEAFSIDGISSGLGSADNKITVNLTMSLPVKSANDDADSFKVSKDVYFRNLVEDKTSHNIQFNGSLGNNTGDTTDPNDFDETLEVLRFEPINITRKFNLDDDVQPTLLNNTVGIYEFISKNNDGCIYVNLKSGYANQFNSAVCSADGALGVTCVTQNNETKKIRLYTKPVKISDETKIFVHHNQQQQNGGYHTYIDVEGININEALKAGCDLQYKMSLKVSNGNIVNTANGASKKIRQIDSMKIESGDADMGFDGVNGIQRKFGLVGDPNSRGIMLTTGNDAINGNENLLSGNSQGKDSLSIHFDFKNASGSSQFSDDRTLKFYITGKSDDCLKNFQ
ncbi:MAG: prepilin-type N-terminal cleavage/methylation domain-containing protein [Lachnospiraceae bacterium]|nr:prepilin-type N-terminal cleavage/methylation domain-containing protein [Lachnospiraceae bacterium]